MSKIILEVDGERHTLTAVSSSFISICDKCSLEAKCAGWRGFPCDAFDMKGVFKKQEIPKDILPLLLILHEAVKEMRRFQKMPNPAIVDENRRWITERAVDSVLKKIQDYWAAEMVRL